MAVVEQADWFVNHYGRLRDICVSPDGRVFLAVSNRDGRGTPRPGDDRIVEIRAVNSTGISTIQEENNTLKIVPNPVNGEATVHFSNGLKATEYAVYDQWGKILTRDKVNSTLLRINTGNFSSGNYFLKITGLSGTASSAFIVP